MIALVTTLLFVSTALLAIGVIAATVQPEFDRIVRLLRHGPMTGAVEMAAVRDLRIRRITPRRTAAATRQIWREAA